jgi:hypothetical protein
MIVQQPRIVRLGLRSLVPPALARGLKILPAETHPATMTIARSVLDQTTGNRRVARDRTAKACRPAVVPHQVQDQGDRKTIAVVLRPVVLRPVVLRLTILRPVARRMTIGLRRVVPNAVAVSSGVLNQTFVTKPSWYPYRHR